MPRFRGLAALATLASLAALAVAPAITASTPHPAIVREAVRPDILMRDVRTFARALDLDDAQVTLVLAFVTIYHDALAEQRVDDWFDDARPESSATPELDATGRRMREELRVLLGGDASTRDDEQVKRRLAEIKLAWRDAVPAPDPASEQAEREVQDRFSAALADRLDAWNARKARLLTQFLADVPLVLEEAQLDRWPAVERRFRRHLSLSRGRLSGERMDLTSLLADLRPSPGVETEIAPLVAAYEIALDDALRLRDAAIARTQTAMLRAHASGRRVPAAGHADEQTTFRVAVRDVNDSHAVAIADRLPPEDAERFRSAYWRRAYPQAFRPTAAERLFATALRRPDFGEEHRRQLEAMQASLRAELDPLTTGLIRGIRDSEEAEYRRRAIATARPESQAVADTDTDRLHDRKLAISRRHATLYHAWVATGIE